MCAAVAAAVPQASAAAPTALSVAEVVTLVLGTEGATAAAAPGVLVPAAVVTAAAKAAASARRWRFTGGSGLRVVGRLAI